jgi:TP901 family phage tail tape measure protein
MATLNEALTLEFKGDATKYMKTLKGMQVATKSATGKMAAGFTSIVKSITKISTVGAAAFAGFAALAVSKAAKAETAFANLAGLFKESTEELSAYKEKIDELAWSMGVGTVKVTEAYYQAVSAGFRSVEDATGVVEAGIRAAIAGSTEMPVAVEAITRVLNAYGESGEQASKISDLLFQTVNYGVTTFDQLAPSIGRVAGIASKAGLTMEEMFAAIASLTKLATTEQAMTQLTAMITAFLKPTVEAVEVSKKYGIELSANTLAAGKFADTMRKLNDVPQDKLAQMFPNIRALKGVMTLAAGGAKDLTDGLQVMNEGFAATGNAYEKQEATFKRIWETFKNSIELTIEGIGDVLKEPMKRIGTMWKEIVAPGLMEWSHDIKKAADEYWKTFDEEMTGATASEKLTRMWKDFADWFEKKAVPWMADIGVSIAEALLKAIIIGIPKAGFKLGSALGDALGNWISGILFGDPNTPEFDFGKYINTGSGYAKGYIPNYASGRMGELSGLISAYMREKKQGPAGSRPVIANDSEYIIPSRAGGQVPNMASGNGMFDEMKTQTSLMMKNIMISSQTVDAIRDLGDEFRKSIANLGKSMRETKTVSRSEMLWGYKKPTFADGGAVDAVVHRGEYVVNDKATSLFMPLLEAINRIGQGQTYHDAGTVNMNFGDRWSDRLMMDKVIPALADAKRRGLLSQGAW